MWPREARHRSALGAVQPHGLASSRATWPQWKAGETPEALADAQRTTSELNRRYEPSQTLHATP